MPKFIHGQLINGIPENKYNYHCWITGEPEIGENTWIGAFTLIDGLGGLTIGKGVNISCGAAVLTHNTVKRTVTEGKYNKIDLSPTVIEDYVFIGENAVILMGCRIGHHSIVGAGAVILQNTIIPPYSLVVGVPGKVVRSIEEDIMQWSRQ